MWDLVIIAQSRGPVEGKGVAVSVPPCLRRSSSAPGPLLGCAIGHKYTNAKLEHIYMLQR